jgi:hypothetical protein
MNSRHVFINRMHLHVTEFQTEKIFLARLNALGKRNLYIHGSKIRMMDSPNTRA